VVGLGVLWFIIFFASGLPFHRFIEVHNIINIPHPMGKTTVDLQLILMGLILLGVLTYLVEPMVYLVAVFSVVSSLMYIFSVLKLASEYDPHSIGKDEGRVLQGIAACRRRLKRAILIWP
jgi:hypothetical protein